MLYKCNIEIKCYSEDVGSKENLRYIITKEIELPIEPKPKMYIRDKRIDFYTDALLYDVQKNKFFIKSNITGAARYYHGDVYEECQKVIKKFKTAGWKIKKVKGVK